MELKAKSAACRRQRVAALLDSDDDEIATAEPPSPDAAAGTQSMSLWQHTEFAACWLP